MIAVSKKTTTLTPRIQTAAARAASPPTRVSSHGLQVQMAALAMSSAADSAEREAVDVAARIVRMPASVDHERSSAEIVGRRNDIGRSVLRGRSPYLVRFAEPNAIGI